MKATRCCCPKESFDTGVSRFSAIPSASNNQQSPPRSGGPSGCSSDAHYPRRSTPEKDAVPGTSSQANGSAGRSTPRRSTREYPGHRKESFPNNRAGSRTNSHKTTTFPIPKPLRPDIHVPCRTLHPSAKSPTPRADYPQKHPAAPAAIRFYPSSNLLLHSPRRAGRRTRPRAGNITTTARQAKCQPRRVE